MDSAVMIRFIEFLDNIFGRINSKRLMIYYGFLLFLAYALTRPGVTTDLIVWVAALATLLAWIVYFFKTPDDKLNLAKATKAVAPGAQAGQ